MLTQVKQGPVFDSQYNRKGRFSTTHSGKNHWTDNKTWYIELYIGGHLACKLWLQSGDVMGGLGEWPINQSINQSINQERIRVTKVTNVTARPLWSLPLSFLSVFFFFLFFANAKATSCTVSRIWTNEGSKHIVLSAQGSAFWGSERCVPKF